MGSGICEQIPDKNATEALAMCLCKLKKFTSLAVHFDRLMPFGKGSLSPLS
jgi:hypothetical protein